MSERVEGTVDSVEPVQRKSRKTGRAFTVYDMRVDGVKYSCGFNEPNCKVGDFVEFNSDSTQNGEYTNYSVVEGTLKVVEKPVSKTGASTTKADYWEAKELRDLEGDRTRRLHAARSSAIEFVGLAHTMGCVPEVDKAKASDKLDVLFGIVDKVTERFFASTEAESEDDLLDDAPFDMEDE